MNKAKVLRVLYWVFFVVAIYLLYVSVRTKDSQLEYTVGALLVWSMAFGVNWLMKRENTKN